MLHYKFVLCLSFLGGVGWSWSVHHHDTSTNNTLFRERERHTVEEKKLQYPVISYGKAAQSAPTSIIHHHMHVLHLAPEGHTAGQG